MMTTKQTEMLKRIAAGEPVVRDGKNHSVLARLEWRLGYIACDYGRVHTYSLTDAGRAALATINEEG